MAVACGQALLVSGTSDGAEMRAPASWPRRYAGANHSTVNSPRRLRTNPDAVRLVRCLATAAAHAGKMHKAVAHHKPPTEFWRGARRAYIDAAKAAAIALLREK